MRTTALIALLLLAGCGDERPPLPTQEQSDQLNEAGAMLDQLEPQQNEAGPEKASALPGPGNRSD